MDLEVHCCIRSQGLDISTSINSSIPDKRVYLNGHSPMETWYLYLTDFHLKGYKFRKLANRN